MALNKDLSHKYNILKTITNNFIKIYFNIFKNNQNIHLY